MKTILKAAFLLALGVSVWTLSLPSVRGQGQGQDAGGGTVKVTTRLLPDGSKSVIKTDVDARTMETLTYDGSDKLKQRVVYALDAQNQPATSVVYTPDGRPAYKCAYKYDSVGRVTEETNYSLKGQLLRRFVYEFGPKGNPVRVRAFDAAGNELRSTSQGGGVADQPKRPPRRRR